MYYLIDAVLFLAIPFTCKGQDVVLTTTSACYNINDDLTLEAEYKGSTNVVGVKWTITGGASTMTIAVSTCSSPFGIPSGFPSGRMSHDCSSVPKYRLTVQTLEGADIDKSWGVDFSLLTGTTSSGKQQQTVVQCETVNDNDSDFTAWEIVGLVAGSVCAVVFIGLIIYCKCLKGHSCWSIGTPAVIPGPVGTTVPVNGVTPAISTVGIAGTDYTNSGTGTGATGTAGTDYTGSGTGTGATDKACCIKVTRTEGNDLLHTATSGTPIDVYIRFHCGENPKEMVLLHGIKLNIYSEQTLFLPLRPGGNYDFQTVDIGIVETDRAMPGWSFQQVHVESSKPELHEFEEETDPWNPSHRTEELETIQQFTSRKTLYLKENTTLKMRFKYNERKQKTVSRHRDRFATEISREKNKSQH